MLVLGAFTAKAIRIAASSTNVSVGAETTDASPDTESHRVQDLESQRFGTPTIEQEDPAEAVKRLEAKIMELKARGIPEHMISERHIRNHSLRLIDLLEV